MELHFRVKRKTIILFVLLFLADHCLWLVSMDIQNIAYEICWILCMLLFIVSFAKNGFKEIFIDSNYLYWREAIFTIIMGLYSSLQGMLIHGQTFAQGIAPQRFMISVFILYFVINKYLNKKKGALESLKQMFCILGYLELILYTIQFFTINLFKFLQVEYTMRFDEVRMNLGTIAVPFLIFNSINNMFKKRRIVVKDLIIVLVGFFYSFGIAKTRILILAYGIAILFGVLLWKNGGKRKIIGLLVFVIFLAILSQTRIFSFTLEGLNAQDDSSKTRELGREYYMTKIVEHPILGCGYINTNNEKALSFSGMNSLKKHEGIIAWVDLGVYGLVFFFGIIGLIWFIVLYGRMTYHSYKISKKGNLTYLMYMIYSIVLSPNGTGFLWQMGSTLSLVLWLCIIEREYKDCYGEKQVLRLSKVK